MNVLLDNRGTMSRLREHQQVPDVKVSASRKELRPFWAKSATEHHRVVAGVFHTSGRLTRDRVRRSAYTVAPVWYAMCFLSSDAVLA